MAPTVDYLNRLVQVAGKYTLDMPFEVGWGNVVLDVTPRGLRSPILRQAGVTFTVHYRLLDGDVVIEADTGTATLKPSDRRHDRRLLQRLLRRSAAARHRPSGQLATVRDPRSDAHLR
jgi:hypothetical protein